MAILQFLAAAEILETDLWQQYNELCGIQDREVRGGSGNKAFTKALAELHGGNLSIESALGVGTTVTISFPATERT